jgi:hypothetical protein
MATIKGLARTSQLSHISVKGFVIILIAMIALFRRLLRKQTLILTLLL